MKPSDFLTELSTEKLAQYKTAAAADASKADKEKDFARGNKRFSGIVQATKKQFANDAKKGVAEGVETPQQQQVRAAISKGMEKWDQNGLATYQSQPAKRHYFASSDWASGQLKGINSIDPDGTVVIELNDTTTAGLVKKLAALGGMPGVKTRQLKMTFDLAKANADGVTRGDVAEGLDEAVGDNYLYHATQPSGMMRILRSGSIKASYRPQEATKARTQSPTVSTTRSKQYAESDDFVNFLNLTKEGNSVIIVFDRNAVANHYKMFSTSQGTQTVGDEFEEVIVVPKGMIPIQGTMKGFYFNPKRTSEIEEFKDIPWFKELLNSPYYMGQKQGVAEEKCPHCNGPMFSEMIMNEKKDACYYKVKSRYKVWPSAYASGALVKCRKKGASNWGNSSKNESSILEGIEQTDESLHDWFNKEKWVRMDTKGNIKGPCAREPGEGKPKCLPQSKAHSLGKKGRASAAARKRREDPNPERSGKAINVNTKKK